VGYAPTLKIERWGPSQNPAAVRQRKSRAARKHDIKIFSVRLSRRQVEAAVRTQEQFPYGTRLTKAQLQRGLADGFCLWAYIWKTADKKRRKSQ
jgi:hypothetical protein